MKQLKYSRFLFALLAISAAFYGYYLGRVAELFTASHRPLLTWASVGAGISALTLLMLGHYIRAHKARQLLLPAKSTRTSAHLQGLFIGYLFNSILPFRLGELIRAQMLGQTFVLSSSLMLALIILERALDGLILGAAAFILAFVLRSSYAAVASGLAWLGGILMALGLGLLIGLLLLYRQTLWMLRLWHRFTELFNESLKNSLRFKIWSVIYGLQKLSGRGRLMRYLGWSLLMWACYLAATMVIAFQVFPGAHLTLQLTRGLVAYLGVAVPSGPAQLGAFQGIADPILQSLAGGAGSMTYLVAGWGLLIIPTALLGVILVLRHRGPFANLLQSPSQDAMRNKLERYADLSQELGAFLDAFFSGNTLSHIVHRLEAAEDIKLIQFFKGGSDASTMLVHQNGEYVVKKIIPGQYAHRLKAQHDWLKEFAHLEKVVKLNYEHQTPSYYAIDIEYYPDYTPFFDYIHSQSIKRSQQIEHDVFEFLFDQIYQLGPLATSEAALEELIQNKLWGKLDQATKINTELATLRSYDTLVINGVEYQNIHRVMETIRSRPEIWHDLASFRTSRVHGDVTVDNILTSVKDHTFKLIDPAPDQLEISGPVFDFGRHFQSLGYGYEFLCRDNAKVTAIGNVIRYEDSLSAAYRDLQNYFLSDIAPNRLEPEELRAVRFHTAVLYSRVLAHRVHINPGNVAKFYAVSVRAFNEFLEQYDELSLPHSQTMPQGQRV